MLKKNKFTRVVAAHQPNFFPWLGYFDKIFKSDIFVVLDDVQFPKSGAGTWSNRVPLLIGRDKQWLTMPIVRTYHGLRTYREMEILQSEPWREKILRTLSFQYARAPFFAKIFPVIAPLVEDPSSSLCEYNLRAIITIMNLLGLPRERLTLSSQLAVTTASTERLIAIVKAVDGDAYLCGGGADGYQEDIEFTSAGIGLIYQNFKPVAYPQRGNKNEFIGGLSVLDALFNIGPEATAALLSPLSHG